MFGQLPGSGLTTTRSGRSDSVARASLPSTFTASDSTAAPSSVVTVQVSPFTLPGRLAEGLAAPETVVAAITVGDTALENVPSTVEPVGLAGLAATLTASLADKSLPQRLRKYKNPDLLVIDEFGFDRIERLECPEAAHLLYKVIEARPNTKP